ncbi:MAG: ribonuclease HII [Chthonomonadales bacterium]|nr:ribonuclease HII [Chthonomonadales bacterium]
MSPEKNRPSWRFEEAARLRGFSLIGGMDEVGRGPIAGPVVAACVVLSRNAELPEVRDSKLLTEAARNRACDAIMANAVAIGVGEASPAEIDQHNILRATHLAMRRAVERCVPTPEHVLVDGLPVPLLPVSNEAIVRGDALCMSVAAASIVAKVTRDRMMARLDAAYPIYGFGRNKGYPTPDHLRALRAHGPCPIHRRSFAPVRECSSSLFDPGSSSALSRAVGETGEAWARSYLERLGHRILATHYRSGRAEIDIISDDSGTIVFTEVKASGGRDIGSPAERLTRAQCGRIVEAALAYLAEMAIQDRPCRFDVVEVVRRSSRVPEIRHYRNAFIAESD